MTQNTKVLSFTLNMNTDLDIQFLSAFESIQKELTACGMTYTKSRLLKKMVVTPEFVDMLYKLCEVAKNERLGNCD